jgi:translation elongation factor EF-Tu-like GTPase
VIKGSALMRAGGQGAEARQEAILELMKAVDEYIRSRSVRSTSRS